eukprot:gene18226-20044_t
MDETSIKDLPSSSGETNAGDEQDEPETVNFLVTSEGENVNQTEALNIIGIIVHQDGISGDGTLDQSHAEFLNQALAESQAQTAAESQADAIDESQTETVSESQAESQTELVDEVQPDTQNEGLPDSQAMEGVEFQPENDVTLNPDENAANGQIAVENAAGNSEDNTTADDTGAASVPQEDASATAKERDTDMSNLNQSVTFSPAESSLFLAVSEENPLPANEDFLRPKDDATWSYANSDPHKQQLKLTNYFVNTVEEAAEIIKDHEDRHNVRFASYYCSKDFGKSDFMRSEHKVFWEDEDFKFTGVPFCIVGRKKMDCQHGKDRNTAVKKQRQDEKMKQMMFEGSPATKKKRHPMTKKHDCPAQIYMKEIIQFPDLRLKQDSKFRRGMGSKKLRQILRGQKQTAILRRVLLSIPDISSHENHDVAKVIETGEDYFEKLSVELAEMNQELATIESLLEPLIQKKDSLTEKKREIEQTIQYHRPDKNLYPEPEDPLDWSSRFFFWTDEVDKALKNVFRLEVFRKHQRETINATLWGKDCLLILPPGAGKSICFQIPAVISEGFTLVIAPLVSLIQDQVLRLINHHINATSLTSTSSDMELNDVMSQMVDKDGTLKILYITPDILSKSKAFIENLEQAAQAGCLSRIVIDEVHCASQCGHNFRPDYQDLGFLRQQFPKTPILGLTSTATESVVTDLKNVLGLQEDCLVFRSSFNRPNLFYEVRVPSLTPESQLDEITDVINTEFSQLSGIVYCMSNKEAEFVSYELLNRGVNAGAYHDDLDDQNKENNHYKWINNELKVLVATPSFGMGIDKPNVRFVIHYTISKSILNYYQETGRAGRDGNPAKCIVFYRFSDVFRHSTSVFNEQTGLENLHAMMEYSIELKPCRRTLLSRYFGESFDRRNCNETCDNCVRMRSAGSLLLTKDITRHAKDILKLLEHAVKQSERLTPFKVVAGWMGKGKPELRVPGMKIPSYSKEDCEHIVALLIINGALKEEFHYTACSIICYLTEGDNKDDIVQGKKTLRMHSEKRRKMSQSMATLAKAAGKPLSDEGVVSETPKKKPSNKRVSTSRPRSSKPKKISKLTKKESTDNVVDEVVIDEAIIDPNTLKFEIGADGQSFIILNQVVDHNEYTSQLKFIENDITEAIVVETTTSLKTDRSEKVVEIRIALLLVVIYFILKNEERHGLIERSEEQRSDVSIFTLSRRILEPLKLNVARLSEEGSRRQLTATKQEE